MTSTSLYTGAIMASVFLIVWNLSSRRLRLRDAAGVRARLSLGRPSVETQLLGEGWELLVRELVVFRATYVQPVPRKGVNPDPPGRRDRVEHQVVEAVRLAGRKRFDDLTVETVDPHADVHVQRRLLREADERARG